MLSACVLGGCTRDISAKEPHRGTRQMSATLHEIAVRADASAASNSFLNRARVNALKDIVERAGVAASRDERISLATDQLRAGDTRDAINGVERIIADSHLTWDSISLADKPLFDLLAVAYLRLGEQQNCLGNPAANICILPLKGGARHTKQEGARAAIARYSKLMHQFPDDRGSQWLLNLAYLQIGAYPDSVPPAYLIRGLSGDSVHTFPEYQNIAGRVGLDVEGHAGGVVLDDLNGDGLVDVFTTSWGFSDPVHVMLADGKGGYADRTAVAGLDGITGGLNVMQADYDNDGDADIVVLRGAWQGENGVFPFSLLRNRGDGSFDDVTEEAGLFSIGATNSAAWGDFNRDGYVDLFVGYESYAQLNGSGPLRSKLFLNNKNGTFTEVAQQVGIDLNDFVKGVTWGDVNNDGLPDLYVSILYGKNKLFMNRGGTSIKDWKFEERAQSAGVELPIASFPTWFFDYDNDGWPDLFVPSYDVNVAMHEMVAREFLGLKLETTVNGKKVAAESSRLYRNKGDGTFEDVTKAAGLTGKVIYAMGSNYGDLDNDGFLDFYIGTGNPDLRSVIPNRMFRNVGGKRFDEVALPGGFGHLQKGHATAFADLDRDGSEDIFMVVGGAYDGDISRSVLFGNPGWPANKWISLKFEGTTANRSAIGARVEIVVADAKGVQRSVHRTVGSGGSFGSGPLELHVGLGPATQITAINVQWPDPALTKAVLHNLSLNSTYHIKQGTEPVLLNRPTVPFRASGPSAPMVMPH
jgi:ASPIC and UnbV/FG-GAP-like repeat